MSFLDELRDQIENSETAECLAEGNQASAKITAMRVDLGKNWHPTGYYSPDQVEQIYSQIKGLADQAQAFINNGLSLVNRMPSSEYPALLRNEQTQLAQAMADGDRFLLGAHRVRENGSGVVDAPDFKQWVGLALGRVDNSVTAAAMISCQQPWWAGLYAGFGALLNYAWGAIKAIAGVVVAAGEFIASVPAAVGQYAKLFKWLLILGVGGLAVYAAMQFYRKQSAHGGFLPKLPEAWQLPE